MTSEQWNLSKAGKPDVATITLLGEKLLEIVYLETQSTLKGHVSTDGPVSQNSVICSFGNTLPQIFAQALDVPDEVKLVSSEKLKRLIAKEIAECVNSVLSMSVDSGKETIPRITPPKRLQCLIQQAGHMIKGLMRNLTRICAPCESRKKVSQSSSSSKTISEDRESLLSETSKTVQEIIKDEVSQFTESSPLESGSTLEMKKVADDVAEVIVDEVMMQNQDDLEAAQSSPSLKKVFGRIKTCAAKQFAQASIGRLVERLNVKYFDSPDNPAFDQVLSRQSIQSVMNDLDALLPTVVGEIEQGQNVSQWIDVILSGETLVLTNELKNILSNHIERMRPKTTSGPKRLSIMVLPPHAIISADLLAMVWCFLGVMRWWLHTESEPLTSRVITHTLEKAVSEGSIDEASLPSDESQGSGSESEVTPSEFTEEFSEEQESTEDGRKVPIRIIVMKLVSRIFKKAKVLDTLRSPNTIIERLFEKIWVEIQDEDFEITPKMMQRLDKVIFQKISKSHQKVGEATGAPPLAAASRWFQPACYESSSHILPTHPPGGDVEKQRGSEKRNERVLEVQLNNSGFSVWDRTQASQLITAITRLGQRVIWKSRSLGAVKTQRSTLLSGGTCRARGVLWQPDERDLLLLLVLTWAGAVEQDP
ncbi:unnamed protein product [Pleuronectes platessa]|uniref:Uncharacterized protein n=1 Tax=Pleuronectes platessa TaxID=8262 RepID=A0A9N7TK67_PLEPL|nr:unnamed protein product [Pleuronectes platessa]